VISPFNARIATPLLPTARGLYAGGDIVLILLDAIATTRDDRPYRITMKEAKVVNAIAFLDTREFDEFWTRVSPA
jgi:hypothetical protein